MKTLLIALCSFITANVFSQSITNTLGTSGIFTIKDAKSNYLTLNQSTGEVNILNSLRLENTTGPGLGLISKGTERFIHNYCTGTSYNTFMGIDAGNFTMTSSNNNTGIGHSSLYSLTTGTGNNAIGDHSLYSNTTGVWNEALGYYSLYSNTTGLENIAIGFGSLYSNNASHNIAVGYQSSYNNTTGSENTAVGWNTLENNSIGAGNTALGVQSLQSNYGYYNTAVGYLSMLYNNIGYDNTAVGFEAGSSDFNGVNLTCIGYNSQPSSGNANNQITLGNNQVTSLRCNVTSITSLSDARDKKNIKDLSLGLDFLMKLKPRQFNWDKREWYEGDKSDGSKMKETPTAGFIAQELDEAQTTENADWLNLVLKDNPEKLEATYGNLLPVMVKAIQELNVQSEKLKVESAQLKSENKELKENNETLSSEVESLKQMNAKIVKLEKMMTELNTVKHESLDKSDVNLTNSK